jgi:hypothetical protein
MGDVRLDERKTRLSTRDGLRNEVRLVAFQPEQLRLRACSEKVARFVGSDMLQLFEPKRFLFDQMSPSGGQAL